jgi:hypothetical protein
MGAGKAGVDAVFDEIKEEVKRFGPVALVGIQVMVMGNPEVGCRREIREELDFEALTQEGEKEARAVCSDTILGCVYRTHPADPFQLPHETSGRGDANGARWRPGWHDRSVVTGALRWVLCS